jgi:heterodisulfide reductase subunit A-like polyferredoxin
MDIPKMIRQIGANQLEDAIITIKRDIALPAVLGRICPAPCEKGCNRKYRDDPVSICNLKRFVADEDLKATKPYSPERAPDKNARAAVVGAGPAGLAAAYYLQQSGVNVHLHEKRDELGGALRYHISAQRLPRPVLDAEIQRILDLGVRVKFRAELGVAMSLAELREDYDIVVLAVGSVTPEKLADAALECTPRGIRVDRDGYRTNLPGVFAGGNAVSQGKMAIRACAHGKEIAVAAIQFLEKKRVTGSPRPFNSVLGALRAEEIDEYMKEATEAKRVETGSAGYTLDEVARESGRCFHCDCRKLDTCVLREYADKYGAEQRRFMKVNRKSVEKDMRHPRIIYEPGKCLKCGLCIQVCARADESLGLTLVNRGFDARIEVPFRESLDKALTAAAADCVAICPTAALSWRDEIQEKTA